MSSYKGSSMFLIFGERFIEKKVLCYLRKGVRYF